MDKNLRDAFNANKANAKLKRDKNTTAMVMMLTMVGGNVVLPEEAASQIMPPPEVEQWENFLIDAHTTDPKKLGDVLVGLALRILPAGDLMKLSDSFQFAVTSALQYIMEHKEIHDTANPMERMSKFLGEDE